MGKDEFLNVDGRNFLYSPRCNEQSSGKITTSPVRRWLDFTTSTQVRWCRVILYLGIQFLSTNLDPPICRSMWRDAEVGGLGIFHTKVSNGFFILNVHFKKI